MDLSKELSKLNKNENNIESIIYKLQEEEENIKKKRHIFEVMLFAKNLNGLVPTLLDAQIDTLILSNQGREKIARLELSPKNSSNIAERVEVRDENHDFLPWFKALMNTYMNTQYNLMLTKEFQGEGYNPITIDLKKELAPQLYEALFTKELKTVLDFNTLHLKLEKNKSQSPEKLIKTNKI